MNKSFGMRSITAFLLVAAVSLGSTSVFAADDDIQDAAEARRKAIAQKMEAATFHILAISADEEDVGSGSGFHVGNGYIVTNEHVINTALGGTIVVGNQHIPSALATLVAYKNPTPSSNQDLALLKIDKPLPDGWPSVTFSSNVDRMDRVSSWGYPALLLDKDDNYRQHLNNLAAFKTPPCVYSEGVVNAIAHNPDPQIYHSADISGGNSGGPLTNSRGDVVGINTFVFRDDYRTVNGTLHSDQILAFLKEHNVEFAMGSSADGMQLAAETPGVAQGAEDAGASPESIFAELEQAAASGDATAKFNLGIRRMFGIDGIGIDLEASETWLRRAAKENSADAKALLGWYLITRDNERDPVEGLELLKRGVAEDADPWYKAYLSVILYSGEYLGIPFDPDESFNLAYYADEAGADEGTAQLAVHYYSGTSVEQDHTYALRLARRAYHASDNALAKALLAHLYYDGNVVEEDNAKALQFAQEAGEANIGLAQGLLAFMYYSGAGVEQDDEAAAAWGQRAADIADPFGQYLMGKLYMEGRGVEADPARAWMYLKLARQKLQYDLDSLIEKVEETMLVPQLRQAERLYEEQYNQWGLVLN